MAGPIRPSERVKVKHASGPRAPPSVPTTYIIEIEIEIEIVYLTYQQ